MFYSKKGKDIQCSLCNRKCVIPDGKRGFCGVRENQKGKLFALSYGKACAFDLDPIEKKPFYHFYPGSTALSIATVGCSFSCQHCQNWEISQWRGEQIPGMDLPPEKIVESAKDKKCNIIAYTYTEPTIFYEYARDTGVLARKAKMKNVFVTNGYATPEVVKDASKNFLDAARIDLKGPKEHYKKVCGNVDYEKVLECISNYHKTGMHIEIITLVIPGHNDKKEWVKEAGEFLHSLSPDIPWHFTRFYPAWKMTDVEPTPVKTIENMHKWAKDAGMNYVYSGNIPGHEFDNTYCPNCNKILIERKGYEVTKNRLTKQKKCPECGHKINVVM
ncbi:MAG: AmmeMemoRadiSam system radical SAM enzyme [Candidatus Micrarchaeota archaeon]